MTQEEWDTVINVDLRQLFLPLRRLFYLCAKQVMDVLSRLLPSMDLLVLLDKPTTQAAKAGVAGFTRALAREVGRFGITANAVAPGFIESEMTASMPPEVVKAGIAMIPVGRIGTPEDMGDAYLYLASKEAGFINGTTLHANGGAMPTPEK